MRISTKNHLKSMLKNGETAIGTTVTIAHSDIAELVGLLGFDWVLFDTEHAPVEVGAIQNLMQAMSFAKTVPIMSRME